MDFEKFSNSCEYQRVINEGCQWVDCSSYCGEERYCTHKNNVLQSGATRITFKCSAYRCPFVNDIDQKANAIKNRVSDVVKNVVYLGKDVTQLYEDKWESLKLSEDDMNQIVPAIKRALGEDKEDN